MSFSRLFGILFLATAFLTGTSFAAKNNSGKVRYTVGDASLQKKGKGDWAPVRMGNKVAQNDNIRTLLEAQVIISLPDGSSLTINENTFVAMSELMSEDGINRTTVDIKNGKVNFDVQKQANKDSQFKFKTGTATAAIRGTEGVVGTTSNGKFVAALSQGRLEVETVSGQKVSIDGGQAIIPVKGDSLIVLNLNSAASPNFFNKIDSLLTDTNTINIDTLINKIHQIDSLIYQRSLTLKDSLNCTFTQLPDTTTSAKHEVKVKCPEGVSIELNGDRKVSNGQEVTLEPQWAASLPGEKKFTIDCYYQETFFYCGDLFTYYKLPEAKLDSVPSADSTKSPLTITTSSPIQVCHPASATIEGTFDTTDSKATLFVTLGNYTSGNLVQNSANGHFSHTINISDKIGNWNESRATVIFNSNSKTYTEEVQINVDKTCRDVNLKSPIVTIENYSDSTSCRLDVNVTNLSGDRAIYVTSIDGIDRKNILLEDDAHFNIRLQKGRHQYKFTATDQANHTTVVNKLLGCYPTQRAFIKVKGEPKETLRVPPPPGNIKKSLYRNLHFTVKGLPSNDFVFIKEITITQSNKSGKTTYHESDLQSTSIDQSIEVFYGTTTTVYITVTLKDGQVLRAKKIYEVR